VSSFLLESEPEQVYCFSSDTLTFFELSDLWGEPCPQIKRVSEKTTTGFHFDAGST